MPLGNINIDREQINKYVLKNKKKIIIAGVLLVAALIALIMLLKLNYKFIDQNRGEQLQQPDSGTAQNPEREAVSTYLPDTSRRLEDSSQLRDPFSRGMVLKGIITGGSGGNLAIIEAGNTVFVAGPGDEITGGWQVAQIKRSAVILKMGLHKLQLEFNGRVKDLTPQPAPAKTTTNQPAAGTADAERGKAGTAGPANDNAAGDKTSPGDTAEQPTAGIPGAVSEPTVEQKTISRAAQGVDQVDDRSSNSADKEGVDE